MRFSTVLALIISGVARGETQCQDCWTESCRELKSYFPKCIARASGASTKPAAATVKPAQVKAIQWVDHGDFKLAKVETTVDQYAGCVKAGRCEAPDRGDTCNWETVGKSNHPVNCVDWHQATAFCKWAGGRLPSASEWERAASNEGRTVYPWGDDEPQATLAVFSVETGTAPVGSKPKGASKRGVLDLSGNVWEWASTDYDSSGKELRGGSWSDSPVYLRASNRLRLGPSDGGVNIGFRCAQ